MDYECPFGWKRGFSLAERPYNEKTWFLKWKVKVKDASKQWVDMTRESRIKGPESNPIITYFGIQRDGMREVVDFAVYDNEDNYSRRAFFE